MRKSGGIWSGVVAVEDFAVVNWCCISCRFGSSCSMSRAFSWMKLYGCCICRVRVVCAMEVGLTCEPPSMVEKCVDIADATCIWFCIAFCSSVRCGSGLAHLAVDFRGCLLVSLLTFS